MGEMEVLHPGISASIQDLGRRGYMKYGVPRSGAMDRYAFKTANLLLQNPENAAVLEFALMGPKLRFTASTSIVITGGEMSPRINDVPIGNNNVIDIKAGDVLAFGVLNRGCRCYLGIAGGFRTEAVMGSRSWYQGITEEHMLLKDLKIPYAIFESKKEISLHAAFKPASGYLDSIELKMFPGPEYSILDNGIRKKLLSSTFSISRKNDRMAIQLAESLGNDLEGIITGPVVPGTVQLTSGGNLIILMRDCQTTGGYPRILQLSEKSLDIVSQKTAGDPVEFHW